MEKTSRKTPITGSRGAMKLAGARKRSARPSGPSRAVHEEVYERMRRAIIAGQLEPGRALSVRTLAAEFGVSTMPAREAIRQLAALGALEFTPTRRVAVAQISKDKLQEIRDARLVLEPALAGRAYDRADATPKGRDKLANKLEAIDLALDKAIERGDSAGYTKLNSDFHFMLYETARATVYLGLIESLWLQVGPFMRIVVSRVGTAELVDQHKEAIDALREGDRDKLVRAIRDDITEGMANIAAADI